MYGLADAGGSFELTNIRAIWLKVSAIRPNLTLRKVKSALEDFEKHGLLFTWNEKGKKFGHWVGSRKPGRLPKPSTINRYYLVCPQPPTESMAKYDSRFMGDSGHVSDHDKVLVLEVEGNRNGIGFGIGAQTSRATRDRLSSLERILMENPSLSSGEKTKIETKIKELRGMVT